MSKVFESTGMGKQLCVVQYIHTYLVLLFTELLWPALLFLGN